MRPTIKLIAELSGVSRGTVDRVLHNRPNVHPEKREKVLQVMKELNYEPNEAARTLALNKIDLKLGIILPSWGGFFEIEILKGIEDGSAALQNLGIEVIVKRYQSPLPDECLRFIDELTEEGVTGFALCAKDSVVIREKIEELSEKGIPVVTVNSEITDSRRLCFIGENRKQSGRIAAEIMSKLVKKNDELLIMTGILEYDAHANRVEGFCQRLKELGVREDTYQVVEGFNDYSICFDKIYNILSAPNKIKGIYMGTDYVEACVEALKRTGKINKIRVIGHDLSEPVKGFLRDGSIDFAIGQDIYQQGYRALMILKDYLISGTKPEKEYDYTPINIANAENMEYI